MPFPSKSPAAIESDVVLGRILPLVIVTLVSNFGTFLLYMLTCLVAIVAFREHHSFHGFKHMVVPVFGLIANLACMLFYLIGPFTVSGMSWKEPYIALLVAVLGTTISPYLFFWQALHRVEEMQEEDLGGERAVPLRRRGRRARKSKQLMSRLDVFTGMAFSNVVMFAIITATAATVGRTHHVTIDSPAQAASALRPVAGRFGQAVFAFGFIGSGMLAVPVLAGAGSAAMAGLIGKGAGFSNSLRKAPVFYLRIRFREVSVHNSKARGAPALVPAYTATGATTIDNKRTHTYT